MNEKKLCNALKSSDQTALKKIMDNYSGYAAAVARNISRGSLSEDDIDEVLSETFYKLWKYRENIDSETGLRPYLSAIVRSTVINLMKSDTPADEDISELLLPSDFSVENIAEMNELMKLIERRLKMLPDDEQEIFFRFYFYGESSAVISKTMDITDNTVRTKLHRTRLKLKEYLTEKGYNYV